jgi:hypothetical protein
VDDHDPCWHRRHPHKDIRHELALRDGEVSRSRERLTLRLETQQRHTHAPQVNGSGSIRLCAAYFPNSGQVFYQAGAPHISFPVPECGWRPRGRPSVTEAETYCVVCLEIGRVVFLPAALHGDVRRLSQNIDRRTGFTRENSSSDRRQDNAVPNLVGDDDGENGTRFLDRLVIDPTGDPAPIQPHS